MKTELINLDNIRIDGGTQVRASLNTETVASYAEAIEAGSKFPPLVVFFDGKHKWLGDGFHRYHGYLKAGHQSAGCEVRPGTQQDALLFAVGANGDHGLPRTNADKRAAVVICLKHDEWSKRSDSWIAEACKVSQQFVSKLRKESRLTTVVSRSETRIGKDGRVLQVNSEKRSEAKKPAAVPETPAEEPPKKKITGGTSFNVEELEGPPLSELRDGEGNPVPARCEEAFREVEKFDEAARLCSRVKSLVNELSEGPASAHLKAQMATSDLVNARTAIVFARPHVPCPRKDCSEACTLCRGGGFLTKDAFSRLPAKERK